MKYQAFVRAAAGALAVAAFSATAFAQAQPNPVTMIDTAPSPAAERSSLGAVIMMDQPVLAQREAMQAAQERAVDTRALGAGPARVIRRVQTQDEIEFQRALDEAMRRTQVIPK